MRALADLDTFCQKKRARTPQKARKKTGSGAGVGVGKTELIMKVAEPVDFYYSELQQQ